MSDPNKNNSLEERKPISMLDPVMVEIGEIVGNDDARLEIEHHEGFLIFLRDLWFEKKLPVYDILFGLKAWLLNEIRSGKVESGSKTLIKLDNLLRQEQLKKEMLAARKDIQKITGKDVERAVDSSQAIREKLPTMSEDDFERALAENDRPTLTEAIVSPFAAVVAPAENPQKETDRAPAAVKVSKTTAPNPGASEEFVEKTGVHRISQIPTEIPDKPLDPKIIDQRFSDNPDSLKPPKPVRIDSSSALEKAPALAPLRKKHTPGKR